MNFKDACIVMTEGHIDDDGKVYGTFNLVDTPVGKIVKTFQDAGVQFGISVRGVGDVNGNSVDPETFVFRGFDLVAFPAFPDSIPEFTAIAASTDLKKRSQYRAVCAAVRNNIEEIDDIEAINTIQSQFAEQSKEYSLLEDRKNEIIKGTDDEDSILDEKLEGVMQLYLGEKARVAELLAQLEYYQSLNTQIVSSHKRELTSLRKITTAQMDDLSDQLDKVEDDYDKLTNRNAVLASQLKALKSEKSNLMKDNKSLTSKLDSIQASKQTIKDRNIENIQELESLKDSNLKYRQKIEAARDDLSSKEEIIASKDAEISRLRSDLAETVSQQDSKISNLDKKNQELEGAITASEKLISEYQDAYANLYAATLGVNLDNIYISATTRVDELKSEIQRTGNMLSYEDTTDVVDDVVVPVDDSIVTV